MECLFELCSSVIVSFSLATILLTQPLIDLLLIVTIHMPTHFIRARPFHSLLVDVVSAIASKWLFYLSGCSPCSNLNFALRDTKFIVHTIYCSQHSLNSEALLHSLI